MTNQKNESKKGTRYLWGILLFCLLLFIDQLTKALADAYFEKGEYVEIIPGWVNLCITYNQGIAYGIGRDASPILKIAVIAGTAIMMFALAIAYFKLDDSRNLIRIALVLIVAGGVGNLIDRVYYRVWSADAVYGVRDMVDLNSIGFAVCNFADFFISGGAVTLVVALLFFDKEAIFPLGKYKEQARAYEAEKAQKEKEEEERKNAILPKIE